MILEEFIKKSPKAELHLHIEGTLEPELMFSLAKRNNIEIPFKSIDDVKKAYNFSNLDSFLKIYYEKLRPGGTLIMWFDLWKIESLKTGPYTAGKDIDFGPVVTKEAQNKILGLVDKGVEQGASLKVDGRNFKMQGYENGFFVGACLFDNVTKEMEIYKQEIFGPVLSTVRTKNYEEALDLVRTNQYGNGTAIFTRDGDTARDFANKVNVGMVGVNVPIPVPLAYHTFGGWKKSAFGDLNQHGPDAFRFYTKTKTVTSRWPTGIKEGASFSIPTME